MKLFSTLKKGRSINGKCTAIRVFGAEQLGYDKNVPGSYFSYCSEVIP